MTKARAKQLFFNAFKLCAILFFAMMISDESGFFTAISIAGTFIAVMHVQNKVNDTIDVTLAGLKPIADVGSIIVDNQKKINVLIKETIKLGNIMKQDTIDDKNLYDKIFDILQKHEGKLQVLTIEKNTNRA